MTYDDLQNVNESLLSIDVKGKDYVLVNERVKAFRMLYPEGTIKSELLSNDNGMCVIRTTVGYEDEAGFHVLATGMAYEKEGSSFINKTSYIENCETSAVGRALGFLGLGIETSIASAEEVQNAITNQPIDKVKVKVLKDDIANGVVKSEADLFKFFKVKSWDEITESMFRNYVAKREEKK